MSEAYVYETVVLTGWADVHTFSDPKWLFRGHAQEEWGLQSSFDRCCVLEQIEQADRDRFETALLREFKRSYHHYDHRIPEITAHVEWLSLMQHHGAPTRLLDFTYSLYIAAYFATEHAGGNSAVWAIDRTWALDAAMNCHRLLGKSTACEEYLKRPFWPEREIHNHSLFFTHPFVKSVCPTNPFHLNQRLRTQKGIFLIPGDIEATFGENLAAMQSASDRDKIVKIVIPHYCRREALRSLADMNISHTSLFPGLDGFARSLGLNIALINPSW